MQTTPITKDEIRIEILKTISFILKEKKRLTPSQREILIDLGRAPDDELMLWDCRHHLNGTVKIRPAENKPHRK